MEMIIYRIIYVSSKSLGFFLGALDEVTFKDAEGLALDWPLGLTDGLADFNIKKASLASVSGLADGCPAVGGVESRIVLSSPLVVPHSIGSGLMPVKVLSTYWTCFVLSNMLSQTTLPFPSVTYR